MVKEISWAFILSTVSIVGLNYLDSVFPLGGNLQAIVGLIFLGIAFFLLRKDKKLYRQYGICINNPALSIFYVVLAITIFFPIVTGGIYLWIWAGFWDLWGITHKTFSFSWPTGYFQVFLGHLFVVALPEEIFFRGYLMGRLTEIFPSKLKFLGVPAGKADIIQAALFAIGHFAITFDPSRLAVFFPALTFGWLKTKTKSILAPVIFHFMCNVFMDLFLYGYK